MKRKRLATILALGALLVMVLPVNAGTQGGCAAGDTTKVRVYENSANDHSDGDDQLYVCGNTADLFSVLHTLPGDCNVGLFIGQPDWGGCISSYVAYIPSGYRVCFYNGVNYSGLLQYSVGPLAGTHFNIDAANTNDRTSSIKFTTGSC